MALSDRIAKSFPSIPRLFNSVLPRPAPFKTQGVAGTPVYAGYVLSPEKSPKLIGQEKYRTFADIMTNTAIIAAGVRYFLNVVARPSWSCEPADDSPEAEKAAEFVEDILLEDLHTPWSRVVRRMGTFRFQGFSIQEWQAIKRDDGRIGLKDIESRPQWTIWRWEVDDRGTVAGMWQRDPLTGRELGIPRGKVIYLVDDTLTDSPEGMGLLRHCVDPAFRLEEYLKQEGFGFQRDLRGIPIGRAPLDELQKAVNAGQMKQGEMDAALQELTNFVALETKAKDTALILNSQPYLDQSNTGQSMAAQYKWGVELASGDAPGLADVGKAIDRLTYEIARILGVESLLLGSSGAGSLAMSQDKSIHLYLLCNAVLRDIRLQAQHDLIWPIWELNGFDDKLMPNLKTEDVSPRDATQISGVLSSMATAGAPMSPDDEAINAVRDLLGLPHVDLDAIKQQMDSLGEIQTQQEKDDIGATGTGTGQDAGDEAASAPAQQSGGKPGASGGGAKKRLEVVEDDDDIEKYSPDQSRDDHGRWSHDGKSPGGGGTLRQHIQQVKRFLHNNKGEISIATTHFIEHHTIAIVHHELMMTAMRTAIATAVPLLGVAGLGHVAAAAVAGYAIAQLIKATGLTEENVEHFLVGTTKRLIGARKKETRGKMKKAEDTVLAALRELLAAVRDRQAGNTDASDDNVTVLKIEEAA